MQSWNVYLNRKLINTVFFMKDCDEVYVRTSLINHDNMHPAIMICKSA